MEKETNELNEIKLKELDSLNAQDRQKFEREIADLRAKCRRLEQTQNVSIILEEIDRFAF
jgi:hypothetical protein